MAVAGLNLPCLLVFGSQTTLPSHQYQSQLRAFLLLDRRLYPILTAIRQLPSLWNSLATFDDRLHETSGGRSLHAIQMWIEKGEPLESTGVLPNVLATPLTVIIHLIQYLHYLDANDVDATHSALIGSLQAAGVQGCCTGLLSAIVVACSESEKEVVEYGTKALRLAVGIGAYIDLDQIATVPPKASTCLAVRWKQKAGRDFLDEILRTYREAYISILSDSNTVTVTCLTSEAGELTQSLAWNGLTVKPICLEGRFHSSALKPSLLKLLEFCEVNPGLQLPSANKLRMPLRSNDDAQVISQGLLHNVVSRSMLTEVANWHLTLSSACHQSNLMGKSTFSAVSIGLVDSISHTFASELGLEVIRIRTSSLLPDDPRHAEPTEFRRPQSTATIDPRPQGGLYSDEAIAVVGMACRFPGADSLDEFWNLLISGTSMHSEIPSERFSTLNHPRSQGKKYFGNFIRDIDFFDHRFFKKSSREAASTDPQQRLLLQVAYEALESTGDFGIASVPQEDTGCYVGVCGNDYNDNVATHAPNAFSTLGTLRAFLTGKISHYFGWTGPSITYDTACSSSAVAIHAACKALQTGECARAVAGGVSLFTSPYFYQNLAAASFLSASGPTKSFDAAADGYCRGEGVGLVVLKKLSNAMAACDDILGVISATAVNQCSNVSPITVPHSPSQAKLFRKLLATADIKPTDVSFVEAHGTGTPVGDPLEFESIKNVFGGVPRSKQINVGSVKANIGHTEGASGVAALIKTILMMKHKMIPAQANFKKLNPKISAMDPGAVVIPDALQIWDSDILVACVNNYGAGGSLAAMIVCQPALGTSSAQSQLSEQPRYPIMISAKSPASFRAYCAALRKCVAQQVSNASPGTLLANISFALANKQNPSLAHLLATTADTLEELDDRLQVLEKTTSTIPFAAAKSKPIILAFGGQTSTSVGLDRETYHASALLRLHLDQCDNYIRSLGYQGLYPSIFITAPQENIVSLHAMQFALQYSCAMAWIDCGLEVDGLIGHSFGQLVALTISGSLSLVDGLKLVCGRASLIQQYWGSESGAMLALEADLDTTTDLIGSMRSSGHKIEIACYNAPRSHVVVGSQRAIAAMEQNLAHVAATQRSKFKRLRVTHGFHSELTELILPGLAKLSQRINFKEPTIPLETCSDQHSWTQLEPQLIVEHTRSPVYFGQAVERIVRRLGPCEWIEAGSNSSITAMARRAISPEDSPQHAFHTVNLCNKDAMGPLADTVVALWKSGSRVQFWPFHISQKSAFVPFDLPAYQFEKTRHWLKWSDNSQGPTQQPSAPTKAKEDSRLLSFVKFRDQDHKQAEFSVNPRSEQYRLFVEGHRVLAQPLFPAPLYFELVAQATLNIETSLDEGNGLVSVEALDIKAPLGSNPNLEINLLLTRFQDTSLRWTFTFYSRSTSHTTGTIQEHASGIVIFRPTTDLGVTSEFERFQRLFGQNRCEDILADQAAESMQGSLIYKVFSKVVHYSQYYEGVRRVSSKDGEVAGLVALPNHNLDALNETVYSPLAVDNFIQVAGIHVNSLNALGENEVFVCTRVDRVQPSPQFASFPTKDRSWLIFSNFSPSGEKELTNDIFVFDTISQKLVFIILGARFQKVIMSSLGKVLSRTNSAVNMAQLASVTRFAPVNQLHTVNAEPKEKDTKSRLGQEGDENLKEPQSSEVIKIEKSLRDLLSKITDVPVEAFKDESTMEDLGIDSLMVMEVTTEIRQAFSIDIPQTDLPKLTTFSKTVEYLCSRKGIKNAKATPREEYTASQCNISSSASTISETTFAEQSQKQKNALLRNDTIDRLAQILAGHLEISPVKFGPTTILADEGLDSLLCVELASDVEDNLGIKIDITQLTMESTFGDLCDLMIDPSSATLSASEQHSSSEVTTAPSSPSIATEEAPIRNGVQKSEQPGVLVGAQRAFEQIRYSYDKFTKETGFFDFWKLVYPSQAGLVVAYVVEALSELGCSLTSMRTGDRVPALSVIPKHDKLASVLYDILEAASLIQWMGAYYIRSEQPVSTTPAGKLYQDILGAYPQHAREHELLHITGSRLGPLLKGAVDPLQILFGSKKNRDLLEDVYTNGPMYEAITKLLGSFLDTLFDDLKNGQTFHILELGGGTGGTTKHVLEVLARSGVSFTYTFTDLSPQLVAAAKRKFSKYDFMDYMVVNVEKPPPADFVDRFHIILSTNCIHATPNLGSSLSNIRQMLRSDGFMSLVEFTRNIFWFDLVFGLLEGWWLFKDGREHVLADGAFWEKSMRAAGFNHISMTDGTSSESRTLRIITGFPASCEDPAYVMTAITPKTELPMETLAWSATKDNVLRADIYYPEDHTPKVKRPVALMIHGGGHIMLSRKDIRPRQIKLLLERGLLPVSVDYRLCPELNIFQGPMADVCNALRWAREELPRVKLKHSTVEIDGDQVVAIGWSTGGHLATTLAWTAPLRNLKPPEAILAFYCPLDYEDEFWKQPNFPANSNSLSSSQNYDLLQGVAEKPITGYNIPNTQRALGGWMSLSDPRSRIVLHMNWKGQALPVLCNGLPNSKSKNPSNSTVKSQQYQEMEQPPVEKIQEMSPYAQALQGKYKTPTYFVHGTEDDLIPWQQAQRVHDALKQREVPVGISVLQGVEHLFDLFPHIEGEKERAVREGYEFLFGRLKFGDRN